jgi:histidyl-tRNA synthetase
MTTIMITLQTLKGFRDFLPEEALKRQYLISKIMGVFEQFGFDPLETPALEYATTLMGKYGDEADKLLYLFEDNGGRKVGLRYDQTVPTARVVAQYPDIPKPFKRYQIQPVWRAENTQKGRYREFLQCDADIIGSDSILADCEIISLIATIIETLGFEHYFVFLNDRSIFGDIPLKAITVIDKLDKIGEDGVKKELQEKGFDPNVLEDLTHRPVPERLNKVMHVLPSLGVSPQHIRFTPTLARGLDYYTSTIFEIVIEGYTAGSVCGGGRYDNLISGFIGKEQVPAVGFAIGFDRLLEALLEQGKMPVKKTSATAFVTIFDENSKYDAFSLAQKLRKAGVSTDIALDTTQKLEKQLKYADKKGIPYVVIQGPEEKERNVVKLKNMVEKTQEEVTVEEVVKRLGNR